MVDRLAEFELSTEHANAINKLLPSCKYVVGMRKNETGEVRFCPHSIEWNDHSLYWWSYGNMGCDCNRELDFIRAGREDEAKHGDDLFQSVFCSDGRFTVVGIWFPDGSDIRDIRLLNEV